MAVAARAQQMANLPTVGFLGAGSPATADVWLSAFMSRLRELGWIEGRNIKIDVRRQRASEFDGWLSQDFADLIESDLNFAAGNACVQHFRGRK
jgi:hypothetical protein